MNGARFSFDMSSPLIHPTSIPTATATMTMTHVAGYITASVRGRFTPWNIFPATAPVRPTVEPTERSIPAFRMTMSIPNAMIALKETSFAIVARLPVAR